MLELSRWKIILVVASIVFGALFSAPNLLPDQALAQLPSFLPHHRLNLGLDLQGGSSLLYEVDAAAVEKERLNGLLEEASSALHDAQVAYSGLAVTGSAVTFKVTDPSQIGQAASALAKVGGTLAGGGRDVTTSDAGGVFTIALTPRAIQQMTQSAVTQSVEIIRRRVDLLGTKEPDIRRQGTDRISIEAPGESDPEKLRNVIGQTAKLTFQLVDESIIPEQGMQTLVPPDDEVLPDTDPNEHQPFIVVKRRVAVDGAMLTHAQQSFDQNNSPAVAFRLNGLGAQRFGQVTTEHVGHRFAIVLDNKVISAPNIESPIIGGNGIITGNFTTDSANQLAVLLNSGALPAPLNVIQEQTVGADLGADAVRAGVFGLAVGGALIFAFIIAAYGLFGIFAALALVVNVLLIIGSLSMTQGTLTLPGIAGLILTMAVAVDANVLIYERMRDEAHAGRAAIAAADAGYRRALTSIFDANVTTLISALIMFNFGAGPVKGFALTLFIGVITSVSSAILVTQLLIGWWFRVTRAKALPIA
jgi:preprotein translocase subunit SecD